jgi:hypothetical protein
MTLISSTTRGCKPNKLKFASIMASYNYLLVGTM